MAGESLCILLEVSVPVLMVEVDVSVVVVESPALLLQLRTSNAHENRTAMIAGCLKKVIFFILLFYG